MNKFIKNVALYVLLIIIAVSIFNTFVHPQEKHSEITYSDFISQVEKKNVSSVVMTNNAVTGKMKDGTEFATYIPDNDTQLLNKLNDGNVAITVKPPEQPAWWMSLLSNLLPIVILIAVWFWMMNQTQGGGGRVMSFGKSRAKMTGEGQVHVNFNDVAGEDEAKEELSEVVDFLKNPGRYTAIGAKIPKGVLLVGPPGTGKTLLAKAVAGEAKVPFFSISGSDFVEMFVGVGASRVRDLFDKAKKTMPCIIFIDEIDAVGRQRGAGLGGGHDEREQTLNQLLVEMDGFEANDGIIVMAATNRADILDKALLRPGRFDRQVYVGLPDVKGREEILKVHSKGKPLGEDVSLAVLARRTPYMTGADLENVMNEAAILAARRNAKVITMRELEEAITRVQVGPEKKSRVITEKDKELVAFHEAGHAVLAYVLPGCGAVPEVSIIPRGGAGGYTMTMPDEEKHYVSGARLRDQIVELLGGHVAEKIVLGDVSTGSTSDLSRASELARKMITEYGMNDEIGPVYLGGDQEVFVGRDFGHARNYSEELAARVDEQLEKTLHAALDRATQLLNENREKLDRIARELINREKLDKEEFAALMRGEELPPLDGGKNPIESLLNA